MKTGLRIVIALAIGFGVAMLLMAIAIYLGYLKAYAGGDDAYPVKIVGITIYQLTLKNGEYAGTSDGLNMGIFSGICMAAAAALEELIRKTGRKEKS